MLRIAFLGVGVFAAYLLAVVLIHPVWLGLVNGWLLAVLAWPELLGMALFSWWLYRTHRPGMLTWSLLSIAWLCYALAQTIWLMGDQVLSLPNLAHPWWSDLLFLLQNPFTYLALLLLPSAPGRDLRGLARLRVFLDSVLLMATVTLLFWYFLLVPRYLQRWNSSPARVVELAYVLSDLGLLYILIFMVVYARRPQMERVVLGLLLVGNTLIVIGDLWYAVLNQLAPSSAAPPAVFWLLGYLLVPLAGLMAFRLDSPWYSPACGKISSSATPLARHPDLSPLLLAFCAVFAGELWTDGPGDLSPELWKEPLAPLGSKSGVAGPGAGAPVGGLSGKCAVAARA